MRKISIGFFLLLVITSCSDYQKTDSEIYNNVPSLEDLSGVWVSSDTIDIEPSIRNFQGQALVNQDLTSVSWLVSTPYSGGYHTGTMRLNGKSPRAKLFRWQPYQALRKGEMDNWEISSSTRMLFEKDAIMWQVDITNKDSEERKLDIDLDMIGFNSKYGGDWQWWYPYPKMNGKETIRDNDVEFVREYIGKPINKKDTIVDWLINGKPTPTEFTLTWPSDEDILNSEKYAAKKEKNSIFIYDSETEAISAFNLITSPDSISTKNSGGTAFWNKTLKPGETFTIQYLMTFGDDKGQVSNNLHNWSDGFTTHFNSIKASWENKWKQIFTPGNDLISGCFPVLETDDSLARKVYYTSPLTMLYLINTNLPEHKNVFLTGGPRWGASITFFWDITLWSELWAVVDPVMMKEHISSWIKIDPSKYYGKDNFGGKGVGNGYSANYWALYQLIRDYIAVTGDYAFLDEKIEGKTILQHLDNYSTNWKNISIYGNEGCKDDIYKLADFGDDEWNLLECVPTYKHIVPSFNIGYTWMTRETAKLYRKTGNIKKADTMEREAEEMLKRILELYAGDGVWYSLYPDNKKIEVRHCLDFTFFGKYIPDDIPQNIKDEMIDFIYRELVTDNWMRAQSLLDVAADKSDRCDHGPLGAFDGWPADIMDALTQMGHPQKALDFYHAIEPVTYEGVWSQAHELWGENKKNKKAKVRIAGRDWANRESSSGVAFAQVMLRDFFSFYPDINGDVFITNPNWKFDGKLYHVLYQGEYYTIEYKEGNPVMTKE